MQFRIVDEDQARIEPYLWVQVEEDGSASELHISERRYLETSFETTDSGRPYTKENYEQKDGWGSLRGPLMRTKLPENMAIGPAPAEEPRYGVPKYPGWISTFR